MCGCTALLRQHGGYFYGNATGCLFIDLMIYQLDFESRMKSMNAYVYLYQVGPLLARHRMIPSSSNSPES